MSDKMQFLKLFGDINEQMVYEAQKPWKREKVHIFAKAACIALILAIGSLCFFHEEVKAAWEQFTTEIGRILGISEDLSSYIEKENLSVTMGGTTLSLNEISASNSELFLMFTNGGTGKNLLFDDLTINGQTFDHDSYTITDDGNAEYEARHYVFNCVTDQIDLGNQNLDIEFNVSELEGDTSTHFAFKLPVNQKLLEKNTTAVNLNKSITLSNGTQLVMKEMVANDICSYIKVSYTELPADRSFRILARNKAGEEFLFETETMDYNKAIFICHNPGSVSSGLSDLKLQLYSRSNAGVLAGTEYLDGYTIEEYDDDEEENDWNLEGESVEVIIDK